MKVYGDHAFIVSEAAAHGMQVFDLRQLRGVNVFTEFTATAHYNGVGNTHNIAVNTQNGYVYLVGSTDTDGYPNVCSGRTIILLLLSSRFLLSLSCLPLPCSVLCTHRSVARKYVSFSPPRPCRSLIPVL